MEIVNYILAMTAALIVAAILIAFIINDIKKAKRYSCATETRGIICENYGTERVSYYGRHQYKTYGKYLVQFESARGVQTQEILLEEKDLQKGDIVEVRYATTEQGVELVNNISNERLGRLLIGFVIVLPLCILFIYLNKTGMI